MKHQKKQFAICVRNEGAEDLEIRKIYQILPDARAARISTSGLLTNPARTISTPQIIVSH
jgi:hypothetical protein